MAIPWELIIQLIVQGITYLWPLIVSWWQKKHPTPAPSAARHGVAKWLFGHGSELSSLAGTEAAPTFSSPQDFIEKTRAKLAQMIPEAPLRKRPALRLMSWSLPHVAESVWDQLYARSLVARPASAFPVIDVDANGDDLDMGELQTEITASTPSTDA